MMDLELGLPEKHTGEIATVVGVLFILTSDDDYTSYRLLYVHQAEHLVYRLCAPINHV